MFQEQDVDNIASLYAHLPKVETSQCESQEGLFTPGENHSEVQGELSQKGDGDYGPVGEELLEQDFFPHNGPFSTAEMGKHFIITPRNQGKQSVDHYSLTPTRVYSDIGDKQILHIKNERELSDEEVRELRNFNKEWFEFVGKEPPLVPLAEDFEGDPTLLGGTYSRPEGEDPARVSMYESKKSAGSRLLNIMHGKYRDDRDDRDDTLVSDGKVPNNDERHAEGSTILEPVLRDYNLPQESWDDTAGSANEKYEPVLRDSNLPHARWEDHEELESVGEAGAPGPTFPSILTYHPEFLEDDKGLTGYYMSSSRWKDKKHQKDQRNRRLKSTKTSNRGNRIYQGTVSEADIRHEEVTPTITNEFHSGKTVSMSYMFATKHRSKLFQKFSIQLDSKLHAEGYLPNKAKVRLLFDTGATASLVSAEYIKKSKFLSDYPIRKIKPIEVTLGDGSTLVVEHAIKFPIEIQGFVFQVIAWVMPLDSKLDMIIGQRSMLEVEGSLDLAGCTFNFLNRTTPIIATHNVVVQPHKLANFSFEIQDCPPDLDHGMVIVRIPRETTREGVDPLEFHVVACRVSGKKCRINFENSSDTKYEIKQGATVGYLDLRSAGYMYVSPQGFMALTAQHFVFLEAEGQNVHFPDKVRPPPRKKKSKVKVPPAPDIHPEKQTELRYKNATDSNIPEGKVWRNGFLVDKDDKYPWIDKDDPRRNMTDSQIIRQKVDFSESHMKEEDKEKLLQLCEKYRDAFSLRDELGECNYLEIELELKDTTPFWNRPYPIKESEKAFVDKEMKRGCLLGILKKGLSSYSSPIMLIPRKTGNLLRLVTDFRFLNSRLKILQCSLPLIRDAIQTLGASDADTATIIDLRDAFHTLRIKESQQKYLGITPYFGSPTYIYQRMPMGLSISPAVFMYFINSVLNEIEDRNKFIAIMDDVFIHSKYDEHLACIERLFQALIKAGLKISPHKAQFFRKKVLYLGLEISYEDGRPTITPTPDKIQAIRKITSLENVSDVRGFCGMVNFLSMFLPKLQEHLCPLYDLLKKGTEWKWTERCQLAFEKIKELISKPPVLVMPNATGKYTLVSDTSKLATGAALYQEQEGKLRLVAYHSKRLNSAAKRYSISELELHGLEINIRAFEHYLRGTHFDVVVDHSALVYIMKARKAPPTFRLQKLVEKLNRFSFDIRFQKGKDMYVSDFLSRHVGDEEYSEEVLPISLFLEMPDAAENTYTQSELKALIARVVEVNHGPPLKQIFPVTRSQTRAMNEQRKLDSSQTNSKLKQPNNRKIDEPKTNEDIKTEKTPSNPSRPLRKWPQKPFFKEGGEEEKKSERKNIDPDQVPISESLEHELDLLKKFRSERPIEVELRGQLPGHDKPEFQEDYRLPEPVLFNESKNLFSDLSEEQFSYKHLPNQGQLRKQLDQLKLKVLNGYNIPLQAKDLAQEQKIDPYFGPIYRYLSTGQYPQNRRFKHPQKESFKRECEDYILIDKVLFRIVVLKNEEILTQLCIPEKYFPPLMYHYHDGASASHQGVTRTYMTLREKFFAPYLFDNIRRYIQCCHHCQSRTDKEKDPDAEHVRVPYDFRPMSRVSIDIKHMPVSSEGYQYILFICCEFSNYVVAAPLKDKSALHIAEALLNKLYWQFGRPSQIICDQDRALTSKVMLAVFDIFGSDTKVVSPGNHGSSRVERYIQTVANMIGKQIQGQGRQWPRVLQPACYGHNTFTTPTIKFSPYELVYLHKPPCIANIEFSPTSFGSTTVREYMETLQARFNVLKEVAIQEKLRQQRIQLARQNRYFLKKHVYVKGDMVYYYAPRLSDLQTSSRKFVASWIGPLKISQLLDETHFLLTDLSGRQLNLLGGVHLRMLKPYVLTLGEMHENLLVTYRNFNQLNKRTHRRPAF